VPPERLSALDASFLYLETPSMHMHVAGVSVFAPRDGGPLTYDRVQDVVRSRLHLARRLRQCVLRVPGGLARPVWVDDEQFDLDFHLRRAALPSPGGRFQLERAVGRVLSRPLDRSKPLWELYVFEGLEGGRTAVLLKMHHALADGIAGMLIASALFDVTPEGPVDLTPDEWAPAPAPSANELVREAVKDQLLHPAGALADAARVPSRTIRAAEQVLSGALTVLGMGPPPPGPFDTKIGPARRFATAEVPFEQVRAIKHRLGGTVNDVVICAVAGGLHALLAERREATAGRSLRAMVPVSVRSTDEAADAGNRVVPTFIDVPVGRMSATRRLAKVRAATRAMKSSSVATSADSIIGLGAYAPPALHAAAARLISHARLFNVVISNVPAVQGPFYLGGARLEANYPAMPLGEMCGLSIACTSLAGTLAFGLTADWDAVRDVEVLARGIEASVDDLEAAAKAK
jgi:diacylglycerol O-acyltransferase / wax synthase